MASPKGLPPCGRCAGTPPPRRHRVAGAAPTLRSLFSVPAGQSTCGRWRISTFRVDKNADVVLNARCHGKNTPLAASIGHDPSGPGCWLPPSRRMPFGRPSLPQRISPVNPHAPRPLGLHPSERDRPRAAFAPADRDRALPGPEWVFGGWGDEDGDNVPSASWGALHPQEKPGLGRRASTLPILPLLAGPLVGAWLAVPAIVPRAEAAVRPPAVSARAVLLIERDTGRVLFAKAADRRLPPASLTKVMTALVALEAGSLNSTVTVGDESVVRGQPRLGLAPGDRLTLRDLLEAMLMTSANDACRAVAIHVGGSERAFVGKMNRKAASLGLANTHFANACGFDAPGHYSSARDLARLTEEALKDNLFAIMVRTMEKDVRTIDRQRDFRLHNTNRLLSDPGVTGLKTGYTRGAGHCLIATAFRNGRSLLLVGLNFRDRWQGALALLRYGSEMIQAGKR